MKIEEATDVIARILSARGIRHAVVSSGSRSLRMVRALVDRLECDVRMIVDERVAAFFALGFGDATRMPVALVCTSGSAMLNYAPAIAEAYYRGVPLIVITADRPREVLDINDGQTIRQYHALENIVKASIDINAVKSCSINDLELVDSAIINALSPRKGPVHINLHLEEGNDSLTFPAPRYDLKPCSPEKISEAKNLSSIDLSDLNQKKILLFVGEADYDNATREYLRELSRRPNIVVIADIIGNCSGGNIITDIESIIGKIKEVPASYIPDLLITLGKSSPISRAFKEWLREIPLLSHWRVNDTTSPEDTYFHLEKTIVARDKDFIKYLCDNLPLSQTACFSQSWLNLNNNACKIKQSVLATAPWSDISAINLIVNALPGDCNVISSNGMSIRYLSLTGVGTHTASCNRGVNGIDGSTSTAIGFSNGADGMTLLISGDMSALYDISGLFSGQLTPNFKMIIIANGGGEIFRLTKATRDYKDRENMLCRIPSVNWENVAQSVGMAFFEADSHDSLQRNIIPFFNENERAVLMVINTGAGNSITYSNILKEIHKRL